MCFALASSMFPWPRGPSKPNACFGRPAAQSVQSDSSPLGMWQRPDADEEHQWALQPLPPFPGAPLTDHGTWLVWRHAIATLLTNCRFCWDRAIERQIRVEVAAREWIHVRPSMVGYRLRYYLDAAAHYWEKSAGHHRKMARWAQLWLELGAAVQPFLQMSLKENVDGEWELAKASDSDAMFYEAGAAAFLQSFTGHTGSSASESSDDSDDT